MADKRHEPLNLDVLFGQAKVVKVIHNGHEYELMKLDALGPRQAMVIQDMQKRAQSLHVAGDEMTDEQGIEMEQIFDEIIKMLCPKFPTGEITFAKKMRIVTYYMEESGQKKAVATALKKQIGQMRSRK